MRGMAVYKHAPATRRCLVVVVNSDRSGAALVDRALSVLSATVAVNTAVSFSDRRGRPEDPRPAQEGYQVSHGLQLPSLWVIPDAAVSERTLGGHRIPLLSVTLVHTDQSVLDDLRPVEAYLLEELNVKSVNLAVDDGSWVVESAEPNFKVIGKDPELRKHMKTLGPAVKAMSGEDIAAFVATGSVTLGACTLTADHIVLKKVRDPSQLKRWSCKWSRQGLIISLVPHVLLMPPRRPRHGVVRDFQFGTPAAVATRSLPSHVRGLDHALRGARVFLCEPM